MATTFSILKDALAVLMEGSSCIIVYRRPKYNFQFHFLRLFLYVLTFVRCCFRAVKRTKVNAADGWVKLRPKSCFFRIFWNLIQRQFSLVELTGWWRSYFWVVLESVGSSDRYVIQIFQSEIFVDLLFLQLYTYSFKIDCLMVYRRIFCVWTCFSRPKRSIVYWNS